MASSKSPGDGAQRPLDEYRRKRDFTRTPRTQGTRKSARGKENSRRVFPACKKHLAVTSTTTSVSRHNGTLLSSGRAEGPSLDPRRSSGLRCTSKRSSRRIWRVRGVIPGGLRRRSRDVVGPRHVGSLSQRTSTRRWPKATSSSRSTDHKMKGSWVLCARAQALQQNAA
jgi:hypothetical protein